MDDLQQRRGRLRQRLTVSAARRLRARTRPAASWRCIGRAGARSRLLPVRCSPLRPALPDGEASWRALRASSGRLLCRNPRALRDCGRLDRDGHCALKAGRRCGWGWSSVARAASSGAREAARDRSDNAVAVLPASSATHAAPATCNTRADAVADPAERVTGILIARSTTGLPVGGREVVEWTRSGRRVESAPRGYAPRGAAPHASDDP